MPYYYYLNNFSLEYAILKIKDGKKGLTLNGLNKEFVYMDDVDLIGDDIDGLQSYIDDQVYK